VKRKAAKRQQSPATAPGSEDPDAGSASVLPMDVQIGDRFTAEGFEWEVLTHPTSISGAKRLRAHTVTVSRKTAVAEVGSGWCPRSGLKACTRSR
jgi:hypothetical protein